MLLLSEWVIRVSFDIKDNPSHQVHRMEACINDNKTEVITFRAPNVEMNMPIDVIQIGDYSIPPVQCVRDLGVVFDHHMTMHHVTFISGTLSSIRDSLTDEATIQLVHAFVSSRIDYCNSLLYGIPEYAIKKLQRVQNLAAPCRHTFVKVQQHNAATEEIALAACEVSHHIQSSAAHLQSTARFGSKLLEDSATKLHSVSLTEIRDRKFTDHAESTPQIRMPKFRGGAPKLWNDLPVNIRTTTSIVSFRSSLQTHLFKLAYARFVQYHHFTNCCFYLIYTCVQYIYLFFIFT